MLTDKLTDTKGFHYRNPRLMKLDTGCILFQFRISESEVISIDQQIPLPLLPQLFKPSRSAAADCHIRIVEPQKNVRNNGKGWKGEKNLLALFATVAFLAQRYRSSHVDVEVSAINSSLCNESIIQFKPEDFRNIPLKSLLGVQRKAKEFYTKLLEIDHKADRPIEDRRVRIMILIPPAAKG